MPLLAASWMNQNCFGGTLDATNKVWLCRGCFIFACHSFIKRPFQETREDGLRLRLLADQVLCLHDRGQDGRAVCLRNARWASDETGSSG